MLVYADIGHCQLTLSFPHYLWHCFNFQHQVHIKILGVGVISIGTLTVLFRDTEKSIILPFFPR